jgi:hypothetical protein
MKMLLYILFILKRSELNDNIKVVIQLTESGVPQGSIILLMSTVWANSWGEFALLLF